MRTKKEERERCRTRECINLPRASETRNARVQMLRRAPPSRPASALRRAPRGRSNWPRAFAKGNVKAGPL